MASKVRTPATIAAAAALTAESRADGAMVRGRQPRVQSNHPRDASNPTPKEVPSSSSWTTVGPLCSAGQIEEATRLIFKGSAEADEENDFSILLKLGSQLAEDPRIQETVMEQLGFSGVSNYLLEEAEEAETTAEDNQEPDVAEKAIDRQTQALLASVKQLQAEVVHLKEELSEQHELNQYLVYQNDRLQDALNAKSNSQDVLQEQNSSEPVTAQEAPHTAPIEDPPEDEMVPMLVKGAIGIAASILLIVVVRKANPGLSQKVAATVSAAVTAAASALTSYRTSRSAQ